MSFRLKTAFIAVALASPAVAQERGSVVRVEPIARYSKADFEKAITELATPVRYAQGASSYRITYWTRFKGRAVQASGVFSVPDDTSQIKGVVSWFHGTEVSRREAPSAPGDFVGVTGSGIFAGNGYYFIAPDYIGFGVSKEIQAYVIPQVQVDASIDLMRAVRRVAADRKLPWVTSLHMIGFSQGGQTVAAVHRALERKALPGFAVKASVGVAGPYDLRNIAFQNAVRTNCENCPAYIALATFAYARYYGVRLDGMLKPEFAKAVPALFDGSKSAADIWPRLPQKVEALLQPDFLKAMQDNADIPFNRLVGSNETWNWAPKAPFKIVYGDADQDVSPEDAKQFYARSKARGGNVILSPAGHVDHEASGMIALPEALKWFDALSRHN